MNRYFNTAINLLIFICFSLIPFSAYSALFGPSNYEECLTIVSEKALSKMAVNVGARGCQMWFKDNKEKKGKCYFKVAKKSKTDDGALVGAKACTEKYKLMSK